MSRDKRATLILSLLYWILVSAHSRTSVVVVRDAQSDNATLQDRILHKTTFSARVYEVNASQSLDSVRAGVCSAIGNTDNVMTLLDLTTTPAVTSLLEKIAQQLHLPYLRLASPFQPQHQSGQFHLQLHPSALVQLKFLGDYLRLARVARRKDGSVAVLSEQPMARNNYATLAKSVNKHITILRWSQSSSKNRQTLRQIADSSITHLIVDLHPRRLKSLFNAMSRLGFLSADKEILLTHLDSAFVNPRQLHHHGAKILALKLGRGPSHRHLAATVRSLIEAAQSPVSGSSWKLTCRSKPWSSGRKVMDRLLSKARKEFGVITDPEHFSSPILNYKLDVVALYNNGFHKISTWKDGEGFSHVKKGYRRWRRRNRRAAASSNLIVTTILTTPYAMTDGDGKFKGLCIDILQKICEMVGVNYTIKTVKDDNFGIERNGKWNGMIGELINGEADVAVAPLTVTSARERVVDFSPPYMNIEISALIRKPMRRRMDFPYFLIPVSQEVWLLVLVSLVITSIVLFVTARLSPEEWQRKHHDSRTKVNQFSLSNCFWFTLGALVFHGTASPRSIPTRIVSFGWWSFALLFLLSYAVSLGGFMSIEVMELPISSFSDLAKQTAIPYGVIEGGSTAAFFRRSMVPLYQRMFSFMESNPHVYVRSTKDGVRRIKQGNAYAFLMESATADYLTSKDCYLMQIRSGAGLRYFGFAFQKGSKWRESFTQAMLKLHEDQTIPRLIQQWLRYNAVCRTDTDTERSSGGGGSTSQLDLFAFRYVFVCLIALLAIAIVAAIVGVFIRACRKEDRGQRSVGEYVVHQFRLVCCTCSGEIEDEGGEHEGRHATDDATVTSDPKPC